MPTDAETPRPTSRVTLEILGVGGEPVAIRAQACEGLQSRQIFDGVMPNIGRMRLRVPLSTLVVVVTVGQHSGRIDLQDGQPFQRLDLRPPAPPPSS